MPLSDSPRAVLFDLFNTLVPGGSQADRDGVSKQMADELGVDRDAFASLVRSTFDARIRGRLGDLRETTMWMARKLGGAPSEDAIERAAALRVQLTRELHSKTWAIPALSGAAGRRAGARTCERLFSGDAHDLAVDPRYRHTFKRCRSRA